MLKSINIFSSSQILQQAAPVAQTVTAESSITKCLSLAVWNS